MEHLKVGDSEIVKKQFWLVSKYTKALRCTFLGGLKNSCSSKLCITILATQNCVSYLLSATLNKIKIFNLVNKQLNMLNFVHNRVESFPREFLFIILTCNMYQRYFNNFIWFVKNESRKNEWTKMIFLLDSISTRCVVRVVSGVCKFFPFSFFPWIYRTQLR